MISATDKIARLLDVLIQRTEQREITWEQLHGFTAKSYAASLASGSVLLTRSTFSHPELEILDQAGQKVFEYQVSRVSPGSPAVDSDELDARLDQLFDAVEAHFSRHDEVVDGLLNELGA